MDTTIYTYQPLMGNGSPSIRLLTLLPGSSLTALSCEINEVQFGRAMEMELMKKRKLCKMISAKAL